METPNTSYAASQFLTGSLKHFTVSFDAVTSFDTYTLSSATIKYDDDVTAAKPNGTTEPLWPKSIWWPIIVDAV